MLETRMMVIGDLKDFKQQDKAMKLLHFDLQCASEVLKTVEFIARLNIQQADQLEQAEFWLAYAHKIATKLHEHGSDSLDAALIAKARQSLKRIQGLRAALLIDKGKKSDALDLLQMMRSDTFSEEEKDVELLVFSLISILKAKSEEGNQARDRAKTLSTETNNFFERKQWLQLPKLTLNI